MFEDEDVILPDDFESDLPQSDESPEQTETTDDVEKVEDTTPTEQNESEPIEETPELFKLKYNKEEMEIPIEEARALAQKGMNFDKAVERARQESRDAVIAEQGYEWNGNPITTEAEYKQALQEQQWMEQYQSKDLPDEVIQELIEGRRDREERRREKTEQEQKAQEESRQQAESMEFFDYFRQINGRDYNPNSQDVPNEVWNLKEEQGIPLKYAYMQHHNKQLQNQIKVLKQNEENAKRAPISGLSTHGSNETDGEDDFLAGFNSI
jgi:hypothetical protein